MEKLKRSLIISIMFTTVLSMSMLAIPLAGQAAASAGDLIKMDGLSSVYYLGADGKRYVFPNETTYFSWYSDFSGVVTIPQSELESYPLGANVTIRPGTKLVKITTDPKVYAVESNGTLKWIPDEATAKTLYGDNWTQRVVDVPDAFFTNYTVSDEQVSATAYPEGSLVKFSGSADVYYIDSNGKARKIADEASFTANRFKWDDVITATIDMPELGTEIAAAEADLIDTSSGAGGAAAVGTGLSVALASDTPASATVVNNAARAPFTKINLTAGSDGDISVKLRVQRTGVSQDSDFSSISFLDGISQLGNTKTLNSSHQCLSDSITVPAGTTRTITIAGNMDTLTSAGSAALDVVEIVTDATVSGTLPLEGNEMSLSNAITIGTATLDRGSYDPNTTATKEIGTTDYTFISFKITANTEAQQVEYIKFTNQGSIADSDLSNVRLYVDNNEYTTGTLSGKLVEFDLTSNPVSITKGSSKEFSLIADIVGGSGRTIDFDVYKTTDVAVKGLDFGYYITPSTNLNAGNIVTVSAGKLTISKSNSVTTGNIVEGTNGVALGAWNFKAQGEGVEISQSVFDLNLTSSSADYSDVTSCTLYDASDNAVTGAVDVNSSNEVTFTDTISVPVGDNVYTIKCNLSTDFTGGDTMYFDATLATAANFDVKGAVTGDSITEQPTSDVAANSQTIKAGALDSYTATTPVAQSLVRGSLQAHLANFTLDATASGEDVKVTQIVVKDTTGSTAKTQNISNIKLYVNGTALSVVKNGSDADAGDDETFTFSLSGDDAIIVPKGETVVVQVKADISASAVTSATHTFDLDSITCQGVLTGTTISSTPSGSGQAMTIVASGTLTTSIDSSNPDASLMAAGSTGVTITVLKMEALYEDIELDNILLTKDVTTAASSTANDFSKLYLYDEDGNKIVAVTPTATTYLVSVPDYTEDADGNWLSGFKVSNEDTNGAKLYVKADLADIGTGLPGTSGAQVGFKVASAGSITATGKESGQGATETGTADSNTHWVYKSVPTVAIQSLSNPTLANGTNTLFKFTVTADAQGDIDLAKVAFTVATTGVTVTGMKVYDTTGTEVELNATGVNADSNGVVNIPFDSSKVRTITAGATRTFVLKGTAVGVGTGDSVVTVQLNGDASAVASQAYPTTFALVEADANDDFIWSDRSASSHSLTTVDWTNGYLVSGLNATLSTAAVLSN